LVCGKPAAGVLRGRVFGLGQRWSPWGVEEGLRICTKGYATIPATCVGRVDIASGASLRAKTADNYARAYRLLGKIDVA